MRGDSLRLSDVFSACKEVRQLPHQYARLEAKMFILLAPCKLLVAVLLDAQVLSPLACSTSSWPARVRYLLANMFLERLSDRPRSVSDALREVWCNRSASASVVGMRHRYAGWSCSPPKFFFSRTYRLVVTRTLLCGYYADNYAAHLFDVSLAWTVYPDTAVVCGQIPLRKYQS